MEKRTIKIGVNYGFEWEGINSLDDIQKDIDAIRLLGATHIEITAESGNYGRPYIEIDAVIVRYETDTEYQDRIDLENLINIL
jgi:hypothetical protein